MPRRRRERSIGSDYGRQMDSKSTEKAEQLSSAADGMEERRKLKKETMEVRLQ